MFSKQIKISPKFIRNKEYPTCERCFNFENFTPIEGTTFEYSNGVCMKFGEKMINGKIKYDYAIDCRNDASKCTKFARYFVPLKEFFTE